MPSHKTCRQPEIISRQFMTVRDAEGQQRRIGVGVTDDGRVAVLSAAGGVGVLSPAEAAAYAALVRSAVADAALIST